MARARRENPPDLLGVAYPALDPETDCESRRDTTEPHVVDPHSAGPGCVRLPYLSVGSAVLITQRVHGQFRRAARDKLRRRREAVLRPVRGMRHVAHGAGLPT